MANKADAMDVSEPVAISAAGRARGALLLLFIALAMLVIAACAYSRGDIVKKLLGPPTVTLQEAYQPQSDGPTFDHSTFDSLVRKHVDGDGWVDYKSLSANAQSLDNYIAALGNAPFANLGRDEKLALLINAYNAFTLRLVLDHYPVESIKDIPRGKRWDAKRWRIGTMTLSLNQIEHEQIRPKFAEPRIHFALVCAAISCPKLRNEAYQAVRLDEQLDEQARYVHSHDRWFRYSPGAGDVRLTRLYDWYGSDFEQTAGSVLAFAVRYCAPLKKSLDGRTEPGIRWLDYDWALNDKGNKR